MRVAFAGSPLAAVPVLEALAASAHEVGLVISQPERPRGRVGTPLPTPVASAQTVEIDVEEDAGAVTARLALIGGELLVQALDRLEAGTLKFKAQPKSGVSLAPKLTVEDRMLDFSRPAVDLANQIRALSP